METATFSTNSNHFYVGAKDVTDPETFDVEMKLRNATVEILNCFLQQKFKTITVDTIPNNPEIGYVHRNGDVAEHYSKVSDTVKITTINELTFWVEGDNIFDAQITISHKYTHSIHRILLEYKDSYIGMPNKEHIIYKEDINNKHGCFKEIDSKTIKFWLGSFLMYQTVQVTAIE